MEEWPPLVQEKWLEPGLEFTVIELTESNIAFLCSKYADEIQNLKKSISHLHRIYEIIATSFLVNRYVKSSTKLAYQQGGKPYLPDFPIEISVTHTKNLVGVAFSKTGPVGVDIEFVSDRINRISGRFMNDKELNNTQHESGSTHRMIYWTMKEAMLKLRGNRSLDFRKDLVIDDFEFSEKGMTYSRIQDTDNQYNCINQFYIESELVISWSRYLSS